MIPTIIYIVRELGDNKYQIADFTDGERDCHSAYIVIKRGDKYICDCMGYIRQHDKSIHKHSRIVRFWVENLEKEHGYAFWLDSDEEIEYHRFINLEEWNERISLLEKNLCT